MGNGELALERVFPEEDIEHRSCVVPFGPEIRVRHRDLVPIICFGAGRGELCVCTSTVFTHVSKYTFIHIVCVFRVFVSLSLSLSLSLSDVCAYSHHQSCICN